MIVKKYKVIAFPNVYDDIKEIEDFIKIDSPANAIKVRNTILKTIKSLKTFPFRYHQDYFRINQNENYRFLSVWSYNIHYKIEDNKVLVLKVIYRGKDPSTITKEINKTYK